MNVKSFISERSMSTCKPVVKFRRAGIHDAARGAAFFGAAMQVAIPDVSAAGAASSLIFLVSSALFDLTAMLASGRSEAPAGWTEGRLVVPLGGCAACRPTTSPRR